jgi:5'-nucleotidase (lipoprotein e(P4) family)
VRNSAEHRAIYLQVYRGATQELERQAAGLTAGTWGVILDADETVLDNSTYQKERAAIGAGFSDSSWAVWLRRAEAAALPGAAAFIARVRQLGGRVGLVTNRDEPFCPDTRENFRKLGIAVDAVLCRAPGKDDKNPRFEALAAGTAVPGLAGFRVLMWLGDNIQDFPGLTQDIRNAPDSALARFGSMYWALPNPMYGSWTSNPRQ